MNGDAGKGSKMRSGANNFAYWQNYDNIFRRPSGEKVTDTFGKYDSPSRLDPERTDERSEKAFRDSIKKSRPQTLEEAEEQKLDNLP